MADATFGLAALKWAWANRTEIVGQLGKVRAWFRSDPGRGILIIGPGGVGKTTLARLLSGEFDWLLDDPWRYSDSVGIEEFALKDDPKVHIVVPPGQMVRGGTTWVEVERQLAAGVYRGVIVVGADGYHTIARESYKVHPLYAGNKDAFLAAYRAACRSDEVAVLQRVAAAVRPAPGKVWFLTLVAKEDLWWPERPAVADRYAAGEYAAVVAGLAAARGDHTFRHEVVTASLVISNYMTSENEVLAKNSAGYDHRQQVESLRRLFEVLDGLRSWEG